MPTDQDGVIKLPKPTTTFELHDGRTFELSMLDAHGQMIVIRKEMEVAGHVAADDYAYADRFGEWITRRTGVSLSRAEAEALWKAIEIERMRTRHGYEESLRAMGSAA